MIVRLYRLFTSSSPYFESLFKNPNHKEYHKVYKNNMGKESFMDSDEGLPKIVTASKSAFIEEDLFIRHSEEYQNCRIEFIPWDRKYGSVSIPITKSSPYEPFMRQVIADVYSTGALKKLQQKWLKTEHQCET